MFNSKRRHLFKTLMAGAAAAPLSAAMAPLAFASKKSAGNNSECDTARAQPNWGKGIEGQRKADLGDGSFRNPIIPGDHPDPTILKDGDDYYMTFSSFNSYPGIIIWHSRDLVNWVPVGPALSKNIGTVWALDLCKHGDRYYVYIPAAPEGKPWGTYVIWADKISGPWSDPIDLKIDGCIDPGHAVGEDGKRYLFVNGIRKIRLSDDGLATDGQVEPAYSPWQFPDDWITENFAPEGPKITRRGDWFYLVTAVGGTAGPVTGHMVIAARSRSINGPWEHCPHNPLVRTVSEAEPWWSRGHATLVEGPKVQGAKKTGEKEARWWMVYHGYENGFRSLGRQTLLAPVEWTDDGWFRVLGGDLSQPLPMPALLKNAPLNKQQSGMALSDDFSRNKFGIQWCFHEPRGDEMARVKYAKKSLQLQCAGDSPINSSPLVCVVGDRAYQAEVTFTLEGEATEAGLLLFYNHKAFVGMGFNGEVVKSFQYADEQSWARIPVQLNAQGKSRSMRMRITNDNQVVTYHYSTDNGKSWQRHPTRMEVAGLNHNVFGGFISLRLGIYAAGEGSVRLSDFTYRALFNS